jgi:hypothetical protein
MLKHILLFLLLPLLAQAQLKEFEVSEMPRPDVAVVQANIQFPEDACIFVYSSIRGLNFRSSLDAIDKATFNAVANRYEILVKPSKQMVFVYGSGFMEAKIATINPNPKDILYFKVEERRQEVVSTEPGTLKITTEPGGADIQLNGIPVSTKTPFTGELPGAIYRLKLQKPKHETLDTLIAVRSGQTTVLSVPLRPTTLWVNISSTPSGADVTLDGTSRGKTPAPASFELDLSDASKRGSKPLRLTLADHDPISSTLDLRPSSTPLDVKHTLTKQKGSFSITSTPDGAQVFINELFKGTTIQPVDGVLDAGNHDLELRLDGYATQRHILSVKGGEETAINVAMMGSHMTASVEQRGVANSNARPTAIGQVWGGGVVFHIGKDGRGLIVALEDQGKTEWEKAKQLCASHRDGGFSDWYLPSKDELRILYGKKAQVDAALRAAGGKRIWAHFYWSSTEGYANTAWGFNFSDGTSCDYCLGGDKGATNYVRAVRAF